MSSNAAAAAPENLVSLLTSAADESFVIDRANRARRGRRLRNSGLALMVASGLLAYPAFAVGFFLEPFLASGALLLMMRAVLLLFLVYCYKRGIERYQDGKRLAVPSAVESVQQDTRPPVLYLRAFSADAAMAESPDFQDRGPDWLKIIVTLSSVLPTPRRLIAPPLTEEELVVRAFGHIGPVIAVGRPGEELPELGAARAYFGSNEWQHRVHAIMRCSDKVVIRCGGGTSNNTRILQLDSTVGPGTGILWEVDSALRILRPEQLILLIAFDEYDYAVFRRLTGAAFPQGLPEYNAGNPARGSIRGFIWFGPNWTPHMLPITWADTTVFRLDTRYTMSAALRQKLNIALDLPVTGSHRFWTLTKRALAAALDCVVVQLLSVPVVLIIGGVAGTVPTLVWLRNSGSPFGASWGSALFVAFLFICVSLSEASSLNATFGKIAFGLAVLDADRGRLTLVRSLARNFCKFALLPITWVTAVFRPGQKALHDVIAGTCVFDSGQRQAEASSFYRSAYRVAGVTALVVVALLLSTAIGLMSQRAHQQARLRQQMIASLPVGVPTSAIEPIGPQKQRRAYLPIEILMPLLRSPARVTVPKELSARKGIVILAMFIDPRNGRVTQVRRISGDLDLANSCIATVSGWRFSPIIRGATGFGPDEIQTFLKVTFNGTPPSELR